MVSIDDFDSSGKSSILLGGVIKPIGVIGNITDSESVVLGSSPEWVVMRV